MFASAEPLQTLVRCIEAQLDCVVDRPLTLGCQGNNHGTSIRLARLALHETARFELVHSIRHGAAAEARLSCEPCRRKSKWAALAPLDLELFEYDVLSALRRQGRPFALPATGLAKETGLSSGAMTNRIDKLEARGLVKRKPDKSDRRAVIVSLTAEGRRAIDEAIQLRLDAADESLQGLSAREHNDLAALLRKVRLTGTEESEEL